MLYYFTAENDQSIFEERLLYYSGDIGQRVTNEAGANVGMAEWQPAVVQPAGTTIALRDKYIFHFSDCGMHKFRVLNIRSNNRTYLNIKHVHFNQRILTS